MIFVFITALFVTYSNAFMINEEVNTIDKDVTSAIIDIIGRYHEPKQRSTIILYGSPPEYLYINISRMNIDLITINPAYKNQTGFALVPPGDPTENYIQTPAGTIIFYTKTSEMIPEGIIEIIQTVYWTTEARFIIYSEEPFLIPRMFFIFWWYNLQFSVILHYDADQKRVLASTFTPYNMMNLNVTQYGCWSSLGDDEMYEGNMSPNVHCNATCAGLDFDTYSESMFLQSCFEINEGRLDENFTIFKDVTHNLKGYGLSLFAVHIPPLMIVDESEEGIKRFKGKDGYFIQALATKMNFTVKFKRTKNNQNFQSFLGGLMDLAFRRCHLFSNTIYLIPLSYPPLSLCYPIEGSGLCFVVHRAQLIPTWVNLANMFDRESLILVTIVFHGMVLLYYYYLRKLRKSNFCDAVQCGYMYTMQLFLSLPIYWVGKNSSLRIFVFLIFWFIFVINFIFQGLIVSLLTIPRTEPEINTFQELLDTGYNIEGYPSPDSILPPTSDLFKGINKRFMANELMYACSTDLGNGAKKACWLDCLIAGGASKTMRDPDGNLYMHIGRDRVHSHFLTYVVPKDSPLKKRVEHYLLRILESGLMNQWRDVVFINPNDASANIKSLKLNDLEGCFYLLGIGYVLSTSEFLIECCYVYIVLPCYRMMKRFVKFVKRKLCGWKLVRIEENT